jgi:hypothetical protein
VRQLAVIAAASEGGLDLISVVDPAHVALVQHLSTHVLASGTIDLQSGKLYLMSADPDPNNPRVGGGRPSPKEGSFEMPGHRSAVTAIPRRARCCAGSIGC